MEDGPPFFRQDITCPALLFKLPHHGFRVRGYHPVSPDFPDRSTSSSCYPLWAPPISLAATLGISVDFFSSGYLDVSVLPVRLINLFYSVNDSTLLYWVSPFGHQRLLRFLSAYRRFSQINTSFIASDCLGIHRVRLIS